jgi:hypothetical protein
MERIRAEMGNPRFTGKGTVIEGVLTLKFLVDCSDVSELAMIEDLSALAEKTVIVTLEPIQQEMRFEKPKQRKTADDGDRQAEIIPKVWELRINAEPGPDAERFWSFIAREALAEIPAALLLAPFLPGSEGEQLISARFTTPEKDMVTGYLITRVAAELGEGFEVPFAVTFVGDTAEAGAGAEPWLAVGKQVLVPMELGPEWANAADHGGLVLATVLEIRTTADGATETVEVEFRGDEDGQVETRILTAEEALDLREPITAEPAEKWPVVGSLVLIPKDAAFDADAACWVTDGFASGEVLSIEDGAAIVRTRVLSGDTKDLAFPVEVLVGSPPVRAPEVEDADHSADAGNMVDDAEPAAGDTTYPEFPVPDHEARAATVGACLARTVDGKCVGVTPCESRQSDGTCGSDEARAAAGQASEEPKGRGRGKKATQTELQAA